MKFGDQWILYFLLCVPLVTLIYFWDERTRKRRLSLWGSLRVVARLAEHSSPTKRRWQKMLEILGFMLLVVALARPLFGKIQETVHHKGLDIVIAVDISSSMLAEDYKPNRLTKAKQELLGLLDSLQGNRIALVAFAGSAVTLSPLTTDVATLKIYLDILDTQLIDLQGTAVGDAIRKSLVLFERGRGHGKIVVLLTDGEDHETKPMEAAREALEQGVKVYTIGIGAGEGEPIPIFDEHGERVGHKRNDKGDIVLTRLDERMLEEISDTTGGKYYRATARELEIDHFLRETAKMEKGELGAKPLERFEERFQVPLMGAILCFILAEFMGDRKGMGAELMKRFLKEQRSI